MKTAIDTNILLDIHLGTTGWEERSYAAMRKCRGEGQLAICPIVFAECSFAFPAVDELMGFLAKLGVELETFSTDTTFHAGHVFAHYRKAGGPRTRILPDFLIGAHAILQAGRLLTRDQGFARQYFPKLMLVHP